MTLEDRLDMGVEGILGQRIPPERADEIVDRQLANYSTTVMRVEEAIGATSDLAELTAEHAGRTLITEYNKRMGGPGTLCIGRFSITPEQQGLAVEEVSPPSGRPDKTLHHVTPDGNVHFFRPGTPSNMQSVYNENGRIAIRQLEKHRVEPTDAEYFKTLNNNLRGYQELLLQVADHAGVDRAAVVDAESGRIHTVRPLDALDPTVSNPAFQATLPPSLITKMETYAQAIASTVNAARGSGNLAGRAFRLGNYFRAALGRPGF
jgi:hypothetical protein